MGPFGVVCKIKFLGEDDATYCMTSTKRIIKGPGIVMEEISGGSTLQRIVDGCRFIWLDDNYEKASRMAKDYVTC